MRRFIECLVPVTACNLKCSYCYVIQNNWRSNKNAIFEYSPQIIGKALSKERLGGVSFISFAGAGETMIPKEFPMIVSEVLKQGHFVNITTNGTLSNRFLELIKISQGMTHRIHFSFSFHYIELKKKKMLEIFFNNIKLVRDAGCSILLQINLCDEYWDVWQEIKELSIKYVGALPQVALTRTEPNEKCKNFQIRTTYSESDYFKKGKEMNSPLFDFTCKNFNIKRKEFCYAGLWSGTLNLGTGIMTGCYGKGIHQNIFENIYKPIIWEPVGHNCNQKYCINSSHFMSQGIIPSLLPLPTYAQLRNRKEAKWYTNEMYEFLNTQMGNINPKLNCIKRCFYNYKYKLRVIKSFFVHKLFIR